MSKTAIIIGATGLTGRLVLDKLLKDERYSKIKIFARKSANVVHEKVEEYLGSLFELKKFKKDFTGDEVFCCIGTTTKKTPDKMIYKKIDHGIPVSSAKLCIANEINTFVVISSLGADPKSSVFYSRIKGEMECAVESENILNTYILRPSIIIGKRNEMRIGESIGLGIMKMFRFILIGKIKKYRAIHAGIIADAMIHLANSKPISQIIESDQIEKLSYLELNKNE